MRITIDADICTGHGRCYVLAPDLCEPDDRGRGVVSRADVPPALEDQARAATANCPERAVSLED
ncbi:MAG TPA: ferredoxin [Acidimicrobiia bacterium]